MYFRVSFYNRSTKKRELMWQVYTSRERAQHAADAMNVRRKTASAKVEEA